MNMTAESGDRGGVWSSARGKGGSGNPHERGTETENAPHVTQILPHTIRELNSSAGNRKTSVCAKTPSGRVDHLVSQKEN